MNNIRLMNKIAAIGTDRFDRSVYNVSEDAQSPDAIMVRSAALHDLEFNPELLCIARCGAGVNNIPVDRCSDDGIVVFNTPGANANAVKELVICALMLASRDIIGGVEWAKTLAGDPDAAKTVEKGKSKFAGVELAGKTLGIIGLGAIGGLVANLATHFGMSVVGYDPYITVDAAWKLNKTVEHAASIDTIYAKADYITIHVPSLESTRGTICADSIAKMKDGVRIINLARADLAVAADVKAALESGKVASYVTDFPTPETIGVPGIVNIPHLGASTEEAEDNCAVMAADQLKDYLEHGNIVNSVNYPTVSIPYSAETSRILVLHKNAPSVIAKISLAVSSRGINIENMVNKSRGDNACTLLEIAGVLGENEIAPIIAEIKAISGIKRVRVI